MTFQKRASSHGKIEEIKNGVRTMVESMDL